MNRFLSARPTRGPDRYGRAYYTDVIGYAVARARSPPRRRAAKGHLKKYIVRPARAEPPCLPRPFFFSLSPSFFPRAFPVNVLSRVRCSVCGTRKPVVERPPHRRSVRLTTSRRCVIVSTKPASRQRNTWYPKRSGRKYARGRYVEIGVEWRRETWLGFLTRVVCAHNIESRNHDF